jgi:hypothetical protein
MLVEYHAQRTMRQGSAKEDYYRSSVVAEGGSFSGYDRGAREASYKQKNRSLYTASIGAPVLFTDPRSFLLDTR